MLDTDQQIMLLLLNQKQIVVVASAAAADAFATCNLPGDVNGSEPAL